MHVFISEKSVNGRIIYIFVKKTDEAASKNT